VPDEALLIGAVRQLRGTRLLGQRLGTAGAKRSAVAVALKIVQEQDRVLTGRLTNDGVPTQAIDALGPLHPTTLGGATPSAGPSQSGATSTPSAAASVSDLASALAAEPEPGWDALARAAEGNRLLLLSAASARLAAATLVGVPPPLPDRGSVLVRTELAKRTAALVYAYEIVASHSSGKQRDQAVQTLDALHVLMGGLGPLGQGVDLPGGWSLPFQVRTAADAARLGREVLERAIAGTTAVREADSGDGLADVAAWSARLQALGREHGIDLAAFPGTTAGTRR
jgi:hypothetical protein